MYLTHPQDSRYIEAQKTADTVTAQYGTGGGNVPLVYTESSFAQYRKGVGTLRATGGALSGGSENLVLYKSVLRRLTPLECERLQGFPDNWTKISWRGKPADLCPDSLRYKAIGNSMAVPVMRWIGERIQLFDCYYIERKRKYVDYDRLYELLKKSPVSFEQIRQETGLDKKGAYQVITTLSLKYPVYSPERGMYALL